MLSVITYTNAPVKVIIFFTHPETPFLSNLIQTAVSNCKHTTPYCSCKGYMGCTSCAGSYTVRTQKFKEHSSVFLTEHTHCWLCKGSLQVSGTVAAFLKEAASFSRDISHRLRFHKQALRYKDKKP